MKDQSHKDDMARAVQGDFDRLRARGVATTLSRQETAPVAETPEVTEPETSPRTSEPQQSRVRRWFRRA